MTGLSNLAEGARDGAVGALTEKRIGWLTPLIGVLGALIALFLGGRAWAGGVIIGAALAWLNFRWLARGLDALVAASAAQADTPKPQVPVHTYFLAMFRYALIALAVYVIFKFLSVPLVSMILGLCALGAAAIAASVYEIVRPSKADGAQPASSESDGRTR